MFKSLTEAARAESTVPASRVSRHSCLLGAGLSPLLRGLAASGSFLFPDPGRPCLADDGTAVSHQLVLTGAKGTSGLEFPDFTNPWCSPMSRSADLPPAPRSAHLSTSCAGRWASGTCITVSWSSSHVRPVSRGCLGLERFTGALLSVARHWDVWNIGHPQLPAPMAGKVAFGATWYLCPESCPGGSAAALTGRSWGLPAGTSGDCLGKILS